ncbi:unnamed protein product, partial [Ectocarpus sp. 12 AP-2014]
MRSFYFLDRQSHIYRAQLRSGHHVHAGTQGTTGLPVVPLFSSTKKIKRRASLRDIITDHQDVSTDRGIAGGNHGRQTRRNFHSASRASTSDTRIQLGYSYATVTQGKANRRLTAFFATPPCLPSRLPGRAGPSVVSHTSEHNHYSYARQAPQALQEPKY